MEHSLMLGNDNNMICLEALAELLDEIHFEDEEGDFRLKTYEIYLTRFLVEDFQDNQAEDVEEALSEEEKI